MKFQHILFALLITTFSLVVHAENVMLTDCELKGVVELQGPTQVLCLKDLNVEDGAKIVTHGFPLEILVVGNTHLTANSETPHWTIQDSDSDENPHAAGPILISARTGSGELRIENEDGPVRIELTSTVRDYEQSVRVTDGTSVETVLNGEDLTLVGPDHHLPLN